MIPIAKQESAAAGKRSVWAVWTSAPHRVMFLPGALQLVAAMALLSWEAGGRHLGWWPVPPWVLPPAWGHAYLMLFALFPWFVFGFAMTAVPNWTNRRIARGAWIASGLTMTCGVVLLGLGFFTHPSVAVAGGVVHLAGWLAGWLALARLVVVARSRDTQAIAILVLLLVGATGAAGFLWGMAFVHAGAVALATLAGIWLFLLPLFLVVSHRLIPFFSSRILAQYAVYRPAASLPFLGVACTLHFLLEAGGHVGWTWVADAPMAAWVGWLAWKWGLVHSFRARLLAMLHMSLAVLAAALALHALASFATLAGHPGLFGRGPLHLLGAGYFAAMTLAMVSRVSLGHSGRALEADHAIWVGYHAIVAVAVTRALADFAPFAIARPALLGAAALAFVAIAIGWAAWFVPIYLSPRADGRPG